MRILLVCYDPYEHGEEEFEELSKEEIENLDGDIWTREYDLTNPSFHTVECLCSDIQSWAEKGGLTYVKELGKATAEVDEQEELYRNLRGSRYQ